jgi:IS5 family transposase
MLRVHFMQQWFSLSDPAMEEAFFDTSLYSEFAQLNVHGCLPDESIILRFPHRLEKHDPGRSDTGHRQRPSHSPRAAAQCRHSGQCDLDCRTAPRRTRIKERDPEMHSSQKGVQNGSSARIKLLQLSTASTQAVGRKYRCKIPS